MREKPGPLQCGLTQPQYNGSWSHCRQVSYLGLGAMPSVYQPLLIHLYFWVHPSLRNISWCQDGKIESTQTLPLPCRYQFFFMRIQKLVRCVPKEYHNKTARIFTLESALPAHCIVVYRTRWVGSLGRAMEKMAICVHSIQEASERPGSVVSESEKRRCQVGRSCEQKWLC